MNADFRLWAGARLAVFEPRLAAVFADVEPAAFLAACRYPILTGGKRIRPLLCLAAAEAVSGSKAWRSAKVMNAAVAVELLHTYSLVHDDLPAMDDDAERRGRPTTHVVYGEATAILVGDALLTEAFAQIAASSACVAELAAAAGARGMVGGQYLDIQGLAGDLAALQTVHAKKTGALIRAAACLGAIQSNASRNELARIARFGALVGLAFQVHDDVLDAEQDAGEGGPPSYVAALGIDGAVAEAKRLAAEAETVARSFAYPGGLVRLARFTVERGE